MIKTPAQEALMNFMSFLSEEHYCAGWLIDLEYSLWGVLQGNKKAFAAGGLSDLEISTLRELSERCEGWIYWNQNKAEGCSWDIGEDFIPLEEWKTKYEEWKKSHEQEAK